MFHIGAFFWMFFVKGNLDQAFLSSAETIFMAILAIITITHKLQTETAEPVASPDTTD